MKSARYYREKYLRNLPTKFCPGCGNGTVLNCFVRAIDDLKIDLDKLLCVSGIGCSAWIPSPFINSDTLHVTHGRAIAFATGAKLANNKLEVVVFTGDGDGAGIGGNHLIHAARRNINLTVILINNLIYAMTGGQVAPTTPANMRTSTTPYGNPEYMFDLCKLVSAAGATYVARTTTLHPLEIISFVKEAIRNRGFSFVEVISQCPTEFGRKNKLDLKQTINYIREITTRKEEEGKLRLGIIHKGERKEFTERIKETGGAAVAES